MFLVYIDYYNYVEIFSKTADFMKYHFVNEKHYLNKLMEKSNIKWFTIEFLLNSANNLQNNQSHPLRNVFLKTLEQCKEQLSYVVK